jgi:hypothetical protein
MEGPEKKDKKPSRMKQTMQKDVAKQLEKKNKREGKVTPEKDAAQKAEKERARRVMDIIEEFYRAHNTPDGTPVTIEHEAEKAAVILGEIESYVKKNNTLPINQRVNPERAYGFDIEALKEGKLRKPQAK